MTYLSDPTLDDFGFDMCDPLVSSDTFRLGMRRLAGGVTVVTSTDNAGAPVGITATAVCSLSAAPPTLLVCANRRGTIAKSVGFGGRFCVNLLASDQADIARVCGGGPEAGGQSQVRRLRVVRG
jgi:flavin reductase (DIM6/NTAB) family NADH-FMN oxidoreductase RutF